MNCSLALFFLLPLPQPLHVPDQLGHQPVARRPVKLSAALPADPVQRAHQDAVDGEQIEAVDGGYSADRLAALGAGDVFSGSSSSSEARRAAACNGYNSGV